MAEQRPDTHTPEVRDALGRVIRVGSEVSILSVESCARGLPAEDGARLRECVGKVCEVSEIDKFGYVWVAVGGQPAYFCLSSGELELTEEGARAI
jgi:hypothetical protein